MKKLLIVTVTLVMLLCGCTQKPQPQPERKELTVYSLSGPTSMGLVKLLDDNDNKKSLNSYVSTIVTDASEVTAAIVNGDADIACLPANAAAALYNKSGGFKVVAINTLGVLYVVENGNQINSIADLENKTVCLTGQGTTPEYALRFLLNHYGLEDKVTLEFKSTANEVAAYLASNMASVGLLPQPFVTAALSQNDSLRIALSLTDEWAKVTSDSILITGVTVVRDEILEKYGDQITDFLKEYQQSVDWVNQNPAEAAVMIEKLGIVAKAKIAENALPKCNLVCITSTEMKAKLSAYLKTLYDANPKTVGGSMPEEGFYY